MKKEKTVSTEKLLGNLTPEQRKEFAAQYNTGLGSGLTPEQYKAKYHSGKASQKEEEQSDSARHGERPDIEANVWSRFDDDGYGIYGVQHPAQNATDEKKTK
ncbi:MAG: hypothetical protein LIO70_09210 [Clostridiales bacterium]|nr:hypothetical protein [Clostridiales bacterium]